MTLRTLYQYVGSLTRPVRYRSETVLHMLCRGRLVVDPSAALPPQL